MLLIPCPWCGPRNDAEFTPGGEAHIARPVDGRALTDRQWGEYLYFRKNIKGSQLERWFHAYGCRRWFNVARDSVTHEISAVYKMGEMPPQKQMGELSPQKQMGASPPEALVQRPPEPDA